MNADVDDGGVRGQASAMFSGPGAVYFVALLLILGIVAAVASVVDAA